MRMSSFIRRMLLAGALGAVLPLYAEEIRFSADSMTGVAGTKSDTTTLAGNAFVSSGSLEIHADSITLSGDDFRYINAEGNIDITDSERGMEFTCSSLEFDRETNIVFLENEVRITDAKNGITAEAQAVEYSQNAETVIMQIAVNLKQKNNICTGAYAMYHKKSQIRELNGNPQVIQDEDTFKAQQITLNLDTQEITLTGNVNGSVTTTKKDEAAGTADESRTADEGGKPNGRD